MSSTRPKSSPPAPQAAGDRRAAEGELRSIITRVAPRSSRLIAAARRLLRDRLPTSHELVYEYRSWLVISYSPSEHGYHGVLAIRADAKGVRLYFTRAKELPDREKVLQGTAQARWIPVDNSSSLTHPAAAALIDHAIRSNPIPFPQGGRGSVVIRSSSRNGHGRSTPRDRARGTSRASRKGGSVRRGTGSRKPSG